MAIYPGTVEIETERLKQMYLKPFGKNYTPDLIPESHRLHSLHSRLVFHVYDAHQAIVEHLFNKLFDLIAALVGNEPVFP
jgi:hypothetical protein